jgi:hypothetical protein
MKDYILNSVIRSLKEKKEYYLHSIPFYTLKPFPDHIDTQHIINYIEENIPSSFLTNIEGIYVGEFPELKEREIHAMFKDGVIYISSFQDNADRISEKLIIGDVIHEIAHAVEEANHFELYNDLSIEKEYNGKKKRLVSLLKQEGYNFPEKLFFSNDHISELDHFLYKTVGYDKLSVLTAGLFLSPYSITSIREYFGNGFEEYFIGDYNYLKEISPAVFNKVVSLLDMEEIYEF